MALLTGAAGARAREVPALAGIAVVSAILSGCSTGAEASVDGVSPVTIGPPRLPVLPVTGKVFMLEISLASVGIERSVSTGVVARSFARHRDRETMPSAIRPRAATNAREKRKPVG